LDDAGAERASRTVSGGAAASGLSAEAGYAGGGSAGSGGGRIGKNRVCECRIGWYRSVKCRIGDWTGWWWNGWFCLDENRGGFGLGS